MSAVPPAPQPPSSGPPPSDGITIRGGQGPVLADLDGLRAAAGALRLAAERLDDAAAHVTAARRAVRVGAPDSPVTARAADDAIEPLLHGPTSLGASAERARELSRALQASAALYGAAEDRAEESVRVLIAAVGSSLGNQPLVAAFGALVAARFAVTVGALAVGWRVLGGERAPAPKEVALALPAEHVMLLLGAIVRGLAPGWQLPDPSPVPGAARLVVDGVTVPAVLVPGLRRRPMRVTARLGATTGPAPVDAAEVLRDVGALYPASGGPPGTVGVERLDHPDGSRSWVVAIPGTQEATGMGWGGNPMDMGTNLRLMAGVADDGTDLVVRALEQAGARQGEPVLLAGHSQGGMVAMALAGSVAFTTRYRVAAVLTAGSPVAAQAVPASTPVLHLEHGQDLVPTLDGRPSPALTNRTTAVRDLRASRDPADRIAAHDPGAAHQIDTYVRTARAVSGTGADPVRAWEGAAGRVLGGPGTRAVRMEFTGTRLDLTRTLAPGPLPSPGRGPGHGAGPVSASGSLR